MNKIKNIMSDAILGPVVLLNIMAYVSWFVFMLLVYPRQFNTDGTYNVGIIVALIGSLVFLILAIVLLTRIFNWRVSHLRRKESSDRFHREMAALEDIDQIYIDDNNEEEDMEEVITDDRNDGNCK